MTVDQAWASDRPFVGREMWPSLNYATMAVDLSKADRVNDCP